jgi:uncharacterized membrane protein YhhN
MPKTAYMKDRSGPVLFGVLFALHLAALINHTAWLTYATKSLLMAALVFWLLRSTARSTDSLKLFALSALLFSWGGDVLLLFVPLDASFFMAGLCAFLIAHFFYLYCLWQIRKAQQIPFRPLLLLPVMLFGAAFCYLLWPHLGNFRIPVLIYGAILCLMLFSALQLGFSRKNNRLIAGGAALFVLSDSFLAWNKFHTPFSGADVLIMLSYGMAQYFLCAGIGGFIADPQDSPTANPNKLN